MLASILIIPIGFDIDTNQGKCTVSGGRNYPAVAAKPSWLTDCGSDGREQGGTGWKPFWDLIIEKYNILFLGATGPESVHVDDGPLGRGGHGRKKNLIFKCEKGVKSTFLTHECFKNTHYFSLKTFSLQPNLIKTQS